MIWRYLLLFFLLPGIYLVFGWYISHETEFWSRWIIERGEELDLVFTRQRVDLGIYLLAGLLIASITLGLTFCTEQLSSVLTRWFRTDVGAIVAILGWSLVVVFILRWWGDFARVLALVAAAILGRLELQETGYNKWQIFFALTLLCLGSFIGGVWAHGIWGELLHGKSPNIP